MTDDFTLRITSLQAPNADPWVEAVVAYLGQKLGRSVAFVNDVPWEERERRLDAGQIAVGWICGWPYVRKMRRQPPTIELLAAPVPAGERYGGRPIYFSDVVVRRDSPYQTFADLRGVAWGYNVARYHLALRNETWGYFGRVLCTGGHENSLRELLAGQLDAKTIDSTVLETAFERQPELREQVRVIDVMGPSPIPPWVVQTSLPAELRQTLRALLVTMHADVAGQRALAVGGVARFAAVNDGDYDAIRDMERVAGHIKLAAE